MITREGAYQHNVSPQTPAGSWLVTVATRQIKDVLHWSGCTACDHLGTQTCTNCDGQGIVMTRGTWSTDDSLAVLEPCRRCIGSGRVDCSECSSGHQPSTTPMSLRWWDDLMRKGFRRQNIDPRRLQSLAIESEKI